MDVVFIYDFDFTVSYFFTVIVPAVFVVITNVMIVLRGWDKLFAVISNNKLAFYKDQKHYKTVCLLSYCVHCELLKLLRIVRHFPGGDA